MDPCIKDGAENAFDMAAQKLFGHIQFSQTLEPKLLLEVDF